MPKKCTYMLFYATKWKSIIETWYTHIHMYIDRSVEWFRNKKKVIDSVNQIMIGMASACDFSHIDAIDSINCKTKARQTDKRRTKRIFSSTLDYSRVTTHLTVMNTILMRVVELNGWLVIRTTLPRPWPTRIWMHCLSHILRSLRQKSTECFHMKWKFLFCDCLFPNIYFKV